MADDLHHPTVKAESNTFSVWMATIFGIRYGYFIYDYIMMQSPNTKRAKELAAEHLICRFCGHPIELLGAWKCECGFKRPGNYFGRCPKCLGHPHYIDCPSCGFTMDVR